MTFIKKDAMHSSGGTASFNIVNAITYGTPMLSNHIQ